MGPAIGHYLIEQELAGTPSCRVFLARHRVLPRRAIVKLMSTVDATVEEFVALQLLREACLMSALHHAGVPIVYESGRTRDRRPWFAVEHVAGPTLGELIAARGPVEPQAALALVRDLAEILDHAHGRGVVHAGLRPDHVVLAPRPHGGSVCVTDWSTARAHDAAPLPYTPTLESWHYTPPSSCTATPPILAPIPIRWA